MLESERVEALSKARETAQRLLEWNRLKVYVLAHESRALVSTFSCDSLELLLS